MPAQLSPTCQKIANVIKGLEGEKQELAQELKFASPSEKSALTAKIKALNTKISAQNSALAVCIQQHPFTPPAPPPSNPCAPIAQNVSTLMGVLNKEVQNAIAPLQAELQQASPGEKAAIAAEIQHLATTIRKQSPTAQQLSAAQQGYNNCLVQNGGLPALEAVFEGTATLLTSSPEAPGPFVQHVSIGLHFSDWDHRKITEVTFSPIPVKFDVGFPIGEVTTTISLTGAASGTFDPTAQSITLTLGLFFRVVPQLETW